MKQTWMLGPEAIHEVGLLGERTVDGVCVTNVPLIGLSDNHRGPPEWGRQSHRAMLLALSVDGRLTSARAHVRPRRPQRRGT